jgi:hypothetical protein
LLVRIFRQAFTVRRSLVVLGAVVGGLAFPAASMAVTAQIKTTPIHKGNQGFQFTLWLKQGTPAPYGGRNPTVVQGILFRHNGNATENDNYTFSSTGGHKLTFKAGKNAKALQFAKVTGTFANNRGSVNLTFKANGPAHHVNVPKNCKGHAGERRTGTLSGSYTLKADNLGTITQKTFKNATISSAAFVCHKSTHGYDIRTTDFGETFVDVAKSPSNKVTETIQKEPNGNGWAFLYTYYVKGLPSTDYKVGSGMKTASITGASGISGKATYTAKKKSSHKTTGKLSGTLAATFAAIGKVQPLTKPRSAEQTHS